MSAGAFGLSASLLGAVLLVALAGWIVAPVWVILVLAGPAALSGAALSSFVTRQPTDLRAVAAGAAVTLVAILLFTAGITGLSVLADVSQGRQPFHGISSGNVRFGLALSGVASTLALPLGAVTGWWVWRRLRRVANPTEPV